MIWYQPITIDELNERRKETVLEHLNITFTEIGSNFLTASMPVTSITHQPMGLLHGGVSCVLAETVASTAANCCVNYPTVYCLGIEINANHIKPVYKGLVFATATAAHIGKRIHVWTINLRDEKNIQFCIARLTAAVINKN